MNQNEEDRPFVSANSTHISPLFHFFISISASMSLSFSFSFSYSFQLRSPIIQISLLDGSASNNLSARYHCPLISLTFSGTAFSLSLWNTIENATIDLEFVRMTFYLKENENNNEKTY